MCEPLPLCAFPGHCDCACPGHCVRALAIASLMCALVTVCESCLLVPCLCVRALVTVCVSCLPVPRLCVRALVTVCESCRLPVLSLCACPGHCVAICVPFSTVCGYLRAFGHYLLLSACLWPLYVTVCVPLATVYDYLRAPGHCV